MHSSTTRRAFRVGAYRSVFSSCLSVFQSSFFFTQSSVSDLIWWRALTGRGKIGWNGMEWNEGDDNVSAPWFSFYVWITLFFGDGLMTQGIWLAMSGDN